MNDTNYRNRSGGWNPINILKDVGTAWRLFWDPRVPFVLKLILPIAATMYWFWPLDLIPGLPFDDIAIMLIALNAFVKLAPQEAVRNARRENDETNSNVVETTWRRVD